MTLPRLNKNASRQDIETLHARAREASGLLKALSHETRLMILCLLAEEEMSVSEIERIVGLPQATVSQQLARLRADELVAARRVGRSVRYRIGRHEVATIVEALHERFCRAPQDERAASDSQ